MAAAAARNLVGERAELSDPVVLLVLAMVGFWMGLSMSGPLLLVTSFRASEDAAVAAGTSAQPAAIEKFWMINGLYWIGLAVLVIAKHSASPRWEALWWLPLAIVGVVLLVRTPSTPMRDDSARQLHRAMAWGLLISWPMAWAGLIYLCHRLG